MNPESGNIPLKDEGSQNNSQVGKSLGVPERLPDPSSPQVEVASMGLVGPSSNTQCGLQGEVGLLRPAGPPSKSLLATEVVYQGTP